MAIILEDEMSGNLQLISQYVRYPHGKSKSKSVSTGRNNFESPIRGQSPAPMYYPERPPASAFHKSILAKAKEHLRKLQNVNQKKKIEDIENRVKAQYSEKKRQKIKEQVIQKLPQHKPKKFEETHKFTPLQADFHERLEAALTKIESLTENQQDMSHEIENIVKDLETLESKKRVKNPGVAVSQLLKKMADVPVYSNEDLKSYADELWLTAAQFEKELEQEKEGYKAEFELRKFQFQTRTDGLRAQAALRIDALETALIEVKLKYMKQTERAEMRLAEMESQMLNSAKTDQEIEKNLKESLQSIEDYPDYTQRWTIAELQGRENRWRRITDTLRENIRSLKFERGELKKELKNEQDKVNQMQQFQDQVNDEYRKNKEIVLHYQIILYDILKKTNLFDKAGKATNEEKIMFQEITDLTAEKVARDLQEQRSSQRIDPKKTLNRMTVFVDEVHDIMMTLDVKTIMKNYMATLDEKMEQLGELSKELATIKVIPPSILPPDVRQAFEQEQQDKSATLKRKKTMKKPVENNFSRLPMISIKEENRDFIEDKISKLNMKLADSINKRINKIREAKAAATLKKINEMAAAELSSSEISEKDEFEKLDTGAEKGGIPEEEKGEFMKRLEAKQTKRAEEAERKERIASAKRKKQEEIQRKRQEEAEKKKEKAKKKKQPKQPPKQKTPEKKKVPKPETPKAAEREDTQGTEGTKTLPEEQTIDRLKESLDQSPMRGFELNPQATTEPLDIDLAANFLEEFQSRLREKYLPELVKLEKISPDYFKLKAKQCEELQRLFQESLAMGELSSKDELALMQASKLETFIESANEIQSKILRGQKLKKGEIPLSDCIQVDLDNDGNLNGFIARPDMCGLVMFENDGKLEEVGKIIKNVNFMNRLLFKSQKDYVLGQKKPPPEKKVTRDIACQAEILKKEVEKKKVEVREPDPRYGKLDIRATPQVERFLEAMKDHVIDVLMRNDVDRKSYYHMIWENQTLDQLLEYQISNVYDYVPESGFKDQFDRPNDITVGQYFQIIFEQIDDKIRHAVPLSDRLDLDLTKLIQFGKPMKPRTKDFNHQTPKSLIDYLITDIKSKKISHYGAGYKPPPKMVQSETQTCRELIEALIKDKAIKDFINQQQIDRALSKEMQELTKTLYDYIEKHDVTKAIRDKKEYLRENQGNPLFMRNSEDIHIRGSQTTSSSVHRAATQAEMSIQQRDKMQDIRVIVSGQSKIMQGEIDAWNVMKSNAKRAVGDLSITSRRDAQTSYAKGSTSSPNKRLNIDLEPVSRGMTASPVISPNRNHQSQNQNQTLPPEMFPRVKYDSAAIYEKQGEQQLFSIDDRSSANEHGGVTVNPARLRRIQQLKDKNDMMKTGMINLSLDLPLSPNSGKNPFKSKINKKFSDSQVQMALKSKMFRSPNASRRIGPINRTTSGSYPPGLVSMSLDLKKDTRNRALLLNQPSVEDSIEQAQELGVNLNEPRTQKGSFFIDKFNISNEEGNSRSSKRKSKQLKDAEKIVYRKVSMHINPKAIPQQKPIVETEVKNNDANWNMKQFVSPIVTTDYSAESSLLNSSVQSRYVDMNPTDLKPQKLQMQYSYRIQKTKQQMAVTPESKDSEKKGLPLNNIRIGASPKQESVRLQNQRSALSITENVHDRQSRNVSTTMNRNQPTR